MGYATDKIEAAMERVARVLADSGQPMTRIELLHHTGALRKEHMTSAITSMCASGDLVAVRVKTKGHQSVVHYKLPKSGSGLLTVPFLAAPNVGAYRITGYTGHRMDDAKQQHHTMEGFHARPGMARVSPIASVFMV